MNIQNDVRFFLQRVFFGLLFLTSRVCKDWGRSLKSIPKKDIVITAFCLLILNLGAFSNRCIAQDISSAYVKVEKGVTSFPLLFKLIEQQSSYKFIYNSKELAEEKEITIKKGGRYTIGELLRGHLVPLGYRYTLTGKHIAILRDSNTKSAKASNLQTTIRGKVVDESGDPLAGVTVSLRGENSLTTTDQDGQFDLQAAATGILVFSSIGYKTIERQIGAFTFFEISLIPDDGDILDEVVVVGYGTQRRRDLTGAIASVSKKHLEYNTAPSVDVLLGGAVAGVNVTQASGQPGAPATIRIRGGNSVNASNNPLYVIDGFLYFSDNSSTKTGFGGIDGEFNPLNMLNPADIASIDVLKDVSATAIYGSRGSNGVILITTKRGDKDKSVVDYQYTFGAANSAKKLDLLNAQQWARLQKDYFLNKPGYSDDEIASLGEGYNWQNAVLQTGISQNHAVSISGGDELSQYFISGNHLNQDGVVLNSGFKRFVGRANYDRQVFSRLKVGFSLTANKSTQNSLTTFEEVNYNSSPYSAGIANSLTYALYIPPVVPFYTNTGEYNYNNPFEYAYLRQGQKTANPISDLNNSTAETIYTGFLGNFYAQYKPIEELTAKVSVGSNIGHVTQRYFSPSYTALGLEPGGIGGIGNKRSEILLSEFTLNYAKKINQFHSLDVLGGFTFQDTKTNYISTLSSGFTNESLGVDNLQDGKPYGSRPIGSGATESKLYSLLGRVNYAWLDRYHLTANFRSDYSTRFAKNHKWGLFPSLGLAWNISDESFLRDVKNLSSLKLRLSGGNVGNQEIGDYEYLQLLEAIYYGDEVAYKVGNSGNEDLRWETTEQYNVGIDAAFFENKIAATLDVYQKKTSDLLLLIPPKLGEENEQLRNVGNLTNKGIEFSLHATPIQRTNFQWTLSGNIAYNRNRITELYDGVTEKKLGVEVLKVGESIGSFSGLLFEGVVQKDEDVTALPTTPSYTNLQPGDPKFRDVNQDNHIDLNDRIVLGSTQPNLTYGFSTAVNYRGFDFFVLLQGVSGNSVYNQLRRYLESPNDAYNASAVLLDSWTENNPSTTVPRITNSRLSSEVDSRYIEYASYLRLKTLTVGYTFGQGRQPVKKWPLRLRIFATAQNLLTITGYKGYDPEIAKGTDLGAFPMPRTFLSGLSITF
ncbi:SusC/RagA family TonB-linked outer membrane protein [Sphingobacterium sp. LRF_L2]|uniref:SusC/RagA family TonB-linked outer membrane protein n=1 Tax=Sphingobacterium sp. LRF_L2 TaxID=3369421 RepID=UPI003F5DC4CE